MIYSVLRPATERAADQAVFRPRDRADRAVWADSVLVGSVEVGSGALSGSGKDVGELVPSHVVALPLLSIFGMAQG